MLRRTTARPVSFAWERLTLPVRVLAPALVLVVCSCIPHIDLSRLDSGPAEADGDEDGDGDVGADGDGDLDPERGTGRGGSVPTRSTPVAPPVHRRRQLEESARVRGDAAGDAVLAPADLVGTARRGLHARASSLQLPRFKPSGSTFTCSGSSTRPSFPSATGLPLRARSVCALRAKGEGSRGADGRGKARETRRGQAMTPGPPPTLRERDDGGTQQP